MATESGQKVYVRPASHAGGPTGPSGTVAYGSRLRLRADFPVNLYNPAAQVILRTMQRYGIVLADGGTVALTAETDLFTTHRWTELGIDARVFDLSVPGAPVRVQDFAVLDTGPRIVETYDCVRNPDPVGGGTLPTLSIADLSNAEGASGTTKKYNFKVTLSQASTSAVRFDIATANGTALAGSDYVASSAVGRSIAAGATSTTFAVTVNGDATVEPDEAFVVNLSNPSGATLADGQATGTIRNDDCSATGQPQLSIADATTTEGASGTKNLSFKVTQSAAIACPVTFAFATANGSATAGSDYAAVSLAGQTIAAGQVSRNISVPILGDTVVEPDENFTATISQASGATIADGSAVGTIRNDDCSASAQPTLSIADASATEGASGTKNLSFRVSLSAAIACPVSFSFATANGTATAGSDYAATTATATIAAGATAKSVVVPIYGDTAVEADETFTATISQVVGASVLDGTAAGTIRNDDP